jgi:hypothetical protein
VKQTLQTLKHLRKHSQGGEHYVYAVMFVLHKIIIGLSVLPNADDLCDEQAVCVFQVMLYEEDEPVIHELLHHPDIRYEPDWTVQKA